MRLVYATDIHGNSIMYETLLDIGSRTDVDAVIIGGDICPMTDMIRQRIFLETILLPMIEDFRKTYKKEVFIMMGNDDSRMNMDVLEKAEKKGILKVLHNKTHKLNDVYLAGYSFISPTPFRFKDWEKEEDDIAKDLRKLKRGSPPKKTIFVFHVPPYKTPLDTLYNMTHVGSTAIREFIKKAQPLLTLHGHIHESPDMSGEWKTKIGKTMSVNPGVHRVITFTTDLKEMDIV